MVILPMKMILVVFMRNIDRILLIAVAEKEALIIILMIIDDSRSSEQSGFLIRMVMLESILMYPLEMEDLIVFRMMSQMMILTVRFVVVAVVMESRRFQIITLLIQKKAIFI